MRLHNTLQTEQDRFVCMNEKIAEVWVDCLVVLYGPGMEMAAAKNVITLGETVMRECLDMECSQLSFTPLVSLLVWTNNIREERCQHE